MAPDVLEDEQATHVGRFDIQSLPQIYNDLLQSYVSRLNQCGFNPYQSYIKILLKSFSPWFVWRFWKSRYVRDFLHVPNALNQDLIGADEILREIGNLRVEALDAIIAMNKINLKRLQKRSAFNLFGKAAIAIGGLIGSLAAFEKVFTLNLSKMISGDLMTVLVGLLLGAIAGGLINIVISTPMLGLLTAFGDILRIAKAYNSGRGPSV